MLMIYAHHKLGQKLHLVPIRDGFLVRERAICGRRSPSGQAWQLTTEVPEEQICRHCRRHLAERTHQDAEPS